MKTVRVALLGFGSVGQALAELLLRKEVWLREQASLKIQVTGILTRRHGGVLHAEGVDLREALEVVRRGESLAALPGGVSVMDGVAFVQNVPAEVLFENTPVNYATGEPALRHIRVALERGMHAITANKGPVVHGYAELSALARDRGVRFLFESTVMDGAPIFSLVRHTLQGAVVHGFRGILNSTTNLILTRMEEEGETLEEAVHVAQVMGIAEADPSGDLEGWDAAVKVAALVTVWMGVPMTPGQVDRKGIRHLRREDVQRAAKEGKRWKLIGEARRTAKGVQARVAPVQVDAASPFYRIRGTSSLLLVQTDVLGELGILEENPGPHTTAYGCFRDFLEAMGVGGEPGNER